MNATAIGQPNVVAMLFFFLFIAVTLGITFWAARRTQTVEHFYAATALVDAVPWARSALGLPPTS